ncbi:MAG TPA: type II toxin-antitoxin system RelE/ParE family toxin [Ensifer sp.]|nr:type II toxin-antitoxin system RelE/ParE family toxin [Ensifer sp.]
MTQIRLSKSAADYVRREAEYLRLRNPAAARKFASTVKEAKQLLESFPRAGNRMHNLQIAGSLTLVVGGYLFDYLFDGTAIVIRHGRTQHPAPSTGLDDDL